MKRFVLVVPFLFTLASLMQLYYVAAVAVSPDQILRPLIVLWAVLLILIIPVYWLLQDWNWIAIFLTTFVLSFYFSPDFFSIVLILIVAAWFIWAIIKWITGGRSTSQHFLNLLASVGVFFVFYSTYLNSIMLAKIPLRTYADSIGNARKHSLDNLVGFENPPDIYYIVLDDYARSDVLQELFGFDNSEFETYLDELGFIFPEDFHSNYPTTHLSVASTLNMEYVQSFSPSLEMSYNRWLMKPFIDHSRVRTELDEMGYQTISISSNWTITENTTTDIYYHPYPIMLTDFEGFILGSTPLKLLQPLLQISTSVRSVESQQKNVLFNFETLTTIPEISGPKFIFAHIISPHPPFVFDKNGNPVNIDYTFNFKDGNEYPRSQDEYKQGYVGQLHFVNHSLQKALSAIIENSQNPPIIILQADHGSGLLTDFTSSSNTCIMERFSPFAAYYFPEVDDYSITTNTSAVNTFRIVFNDYFDAELPLLENRQYYYKNPLSFYEFVDVSSRVDDRCE